MRCFSSFLVNYHVNHAKKRVSIIIFMKKHLLIEKNVFLSFPNIPKNKKQNVPFRVMGVHHLYLVAFPADIVASLSMSSELHRNRFIHPGENKRERRGRGKSQLFIHFRQCYHLRKVVRCRIWT